MHHNILISYSKRGQNNLFAIQYFDCYDITDRQCTFYFHYNIHCANYFTTSLYLITVKSTGSISNDRTFRFLVSFLFVFFGGGFFFYNNHPPPPKKYSHLYFNAYMSYDEMFYYFFAKKKHFFESSKKKQSWVGKV